MLPAKIERHLEIEHAHPSGGCRLPLKHTRHLAIQSIIFKQGSKNFKTLRLQAVNLFCINSLWENGKVAFPQMTVPRSAEALYVCKRSKASASLIDGTSSFAKSRIGWWRKAQTTTRPAFNSECGSVKRITPCGGRPRGMD